MDNGPILRGPLLSLPTWPPRFPLWTGEMDGWVNIWKFRRSPPSGVSFVGIFREMLPSFPCHSRDRMVLLIEYFKCTNWGIIRKIFLFLVQIYFSFAMTMS